MKHFYLGKLLIAGLMVATSLSAMTSQRECSDSERINLRRLLLEKAKDYSPRNESEVSQLIAAWLSEDERPYTKCTADEKDFSSVLFDIHRSADSAWVLVRDGKISLMDYHRPATP